MEKELKIDMRKMSGKKYDGDGTCKCIQPRQMLAIDDFCTKCGFKINFRKRANKEFLKANAEHIKKCKKEGKESEGLFDYRRESMPNNWIVDEEHQNKINYECNKRKDKNRSYKKRKECPY